MGYTNASRENLDGLWGRCRDSISYYFTTVSFNVPSKSLVTSHHVMRHCIKGAIHSQLNWAIFLCDVIPDGKLSKLDSFDKPYRRPQNFLVVFHTENCAVHSGNPTVSSVYLPTPRCHTHKKTHRNDQKKKKTNLMGNLCCAREHSVQLFVQFVYTVKLRSLT